MLWQQVDGLIASPPSSQWKVTRSRRPSHVRHHSYHHQNIQSREGVIETTEKTTETLEESTAAPADPSVAWARGTYSQQVGQNLWRRGRSGNGFIGQETQGHVKLYVGNHRKLGKNGEGHGIFEWPLRLRNVCSSEHNTDLCSYLLIAHLTYFMLPTRILICLVCWSLVHFFHATFFDAITHVFKNVPSFLHLRIAFSTIRFLVRTIWSWGDRGIREYPGVNRVITCRIIGFK